MARVRPILLLYVSAWALSAPLVPPAHPPLLASSVQTTTAAQPRPRVDFNGDGYPDLAIGVRGEDVDDVRDAGAVNVIYGSPSGLTSAGNQFWTQNSPGILDKAEERDQFGYDLAAGDFNGDGFTDLAISVFQEDIGSIVDAGAVAVIYGSPAGLTAAGNQFWHQDSLGIKDQAEAGDEFGQRVSAADFNADGYDDLAVGVYQEDLGAIVDAGVVQILHGSPTGLTSVDNQWWHQDRGGIEDVAEAGDNFGMRVAAGDFNADGYADLVVGILLEDVGRVVDAGAFQLIYGSRDGLVAKGNQFWTQDSAGVEDRAEPKDHFGWYFAVGDFDRDGFPDLAVGTPLEDVASGNDGAVQVFYGAPAGLTAARSQFWHQDSPGIRDKAERGDHFGQRVAAGDVNGDGFSDLAVAAPYEDLRHIVDAGMVWVIFGSLTGLTATGNELWHQNRRGVRGKAEKADRFGRDLASADFNADGFWDVAVGVMREDVRDAVDAGAVQVLYGRRRGLVSWGDQIWHQDIQGIEDRAESGDQLGRSLSGR